MALVTVTYNAWDANREVIPANLVPEVWFRPIATSRDNGLLTDREVKGTLNPTTGAGSVQLESLPGLLYVPSVRWLVDPDQQNESEQNRARGRSEWEPIFPGDGGPISTLPGVVKLSGIWYGYGAPPTSIKKRNDSIYLDITGPGVGVWVPEFAKFSEGVVV